MNCYETKEKKNKRNKTKLDYIKAKKKLNCAAKQTFAKPEETEQHKTKKKRKQTRTSRQCLDDSEQ